MNIRIWIAEKLLRSTTSRPSQWFIDWVKGGYESSTGMAINEDTALKYTAFWAAVRVISGSIGSLPLLTYKRVDEGKDRAENHPAYTILHDRPNPYMDALTFRETLEAHVLTWGNGFAEIQRDGRGRPVALWPLLPDRTQLVVNEIGIPYYETKIKGIETVLIPEYNILHIKGLGFDGLTGYSVVQYHKEAIGLGMATKKYGARLFGNGVQPGGTLEHPGKISRDAAARLRESWENTHQGLDNSHRLAILEEGMTFKQNGISPEDAQCLETQKFSVDDIARIFNLPPHMLASMDRATFSNIENQGIDFLTRTLFYWLRKWEMECNTKLFMPGERSNYFCEFLVNAFLRGDIQTRYTAYNVGRNGGWLSVNDIRSLENMNSIGDKGDIYLEPLNMKEAGTETPIPEKQPEKLPDNSPDDEQKNILINAHRMVIQEAFRKIWEREKKAVGAAAKRPDDYFNRVTNYYNNDTKYDFDNITNVVTAFVAAICQDTSLVSEYVMRFMNKWSLRNVLLGTVPSEVQAKLNDYNGRHEMLAQKVIDDWSGKNGN